MILAGLDIGGTQIKAVAFDEAGHRLASALTPGEALCGASWTQSVRDALAILEQETGARIERVGVAAPGRTSPDGHSICEMPGRLAGLVGLNWTDYLGRPHTVPVLNDAQAALLGEVWCGAAQGLRDCFMLTLGTGVGGAVLSGGRLLTGHAGRAGHLGHISLDPGGPPGIVRTPGSLEDAIGNHTVSLRSGGRWQMTRDLLSAMAAGDAEASAIWLRSVRSLAAGIASLINVLDPAAVILGGGIMAAGPQLLKPLHAALDEMEWKLDGRRVPIIPAQLGDMAGACGAAARALEGIAPA